MRVGLVAQWLRAAVQHPEGRATALRYAGGITVVQAGWLLRLLLPAELQVVSFIVLAVLDLAVPLWAERTGSTAWHPHHIAERYGLFTIILLGEGVLGATAAVQAAVSHEVTLDLVVIAVAGLALVFALWWLYFSEPAGEGLAANRERSFLWGYGHYGMFAALAALGSGLEVAVASTEHHLDERVVSYSVAIPVAIVVLLIWLLHVPILDRPVVSPVAIVVTAGVVLLLPLAADALGIAVTLSLIVVAVAALLAATLLRSRNSLGA
jgi:low temperature requirement protein LtrA